MTDINQALNEFSDKLQEEADIKISATLKLFDQLSETHKKELTGRLGLKEDYTREELREFFDTLELIDQLEDLNTIINKLIPQH